MAAQAKEILDKRRFERMKAGLQIKYRPVTTGEEATLVKQGGYGAPEAFHANTPEIKDFNKVVTEDVSVGGMKLTTPTSLPVGTRLWLQLSIPDVPISVNAMAEVRWTKAEGALYASGLKFESISKADLDKVERYLMLQKRAEVQKKMNG
jgi:c-di-GMP-binding flagellar brake protein YcgR